MQQINHGYGDNAEHFGMVTIMFIKICDFNQHVVSVKAEQLVTLLNQVVSRFDDAMDRVKRARSAKARASSS